MGKACSVVLVGVNGYGRTHSYAALDYAGGVDLTIAGFVDFTCDSFPRIDEVRARGIPCFNALADFFAAGHKADIAFIATPIATHKTLAALAMQNGCHVYCEKPVAGSLADALEMQSFPAKYGRKLEIGFQLSHNPVILAIKRDILAGVWGKAKRLKTIVLWPRDSAYYRRGWAGKCLAADGTPIMDSIASNATAHYIHNMLFLLGGAMDACAMSADVTSTVWRTNDIETFDGCALDITTDSGAQLLYYAAHATEKLRNPEAVYEFENGVIAFETVAGMVRGRLNDGRVIEYGEIEKSPPPMVTMINAVAGGDWDAFTCPPGAALGHMRVMDVVNAGLDSVRVCPADKKRVVPQEDGESLLVYDGLAERLEAGYADWAFVAE